MRRRYINEYDSNDRFMVVTSYREWLNYIIPPCAVELVQFREGRGLGEAFILNDVRFKWS